MQWGETAKTKAVADEEERKHARQVNAARAAEGLASKSTGSVSRSKARALAHRASIDSKFIPDEAIGPPAVRPPPPPKAPTRASVVLLEAQPRLGVNSPQLSSPKLRRPPQLPRTAASKGPSTQRRGQLLRVSLPSKFWSKSGPEPLTVRAKFTESDEGGAVLASSSTTPWQRRVRLRTALEAGTLSCCRCW